MSSAMQDRTQTSAVNSATFGRSFSGPAEKYVIKFMQSHHAVFILFAAFFLSLWSMPSISDLL
jgi:hypothetical protein